MKKLLSTFLLFFALSPASLAAPSGPVEFTAAVEKRVLKPSEQVVLTLKVTGARPSSQPVLPALDGLQVLSSGSSTKLEVVNGVATSSVEYQYILIPLKGGKLTIPPATIDVAGINYRTRPIEIEVKSDAGQQQADRQKPLFAELTVDKETAYLDEQILLTFRFYQSGVRARDFQYTPPPVKGFRKEALGNSEGEAGTLRVGDKLYDTITLRYALFPYQAGDLTIGPATLRCTIPGPRRRTRPSSPFDDFFSDSFFFSGSRTPITLTTGVVPIKVLPLPSEGRPEGEKISVGMYTMEVSVKPTKVKVGDPITVKAVIEGEGNIDTVSAPVIETGTMFKTYEPSSQSEITDRSTEIKGRKTFEEILVPLDESIKEIPGIRFTFFDTTTDTYRTISKGPIPIEVQPAPDEGPSRIVELRPSEKGESIDILKKDIHFIKLSPGRLTRMGGTIITSPLFILLNVIPAACFVCILFVTRKRERLRSDFAYARRSRAYRRARGGVKRCASCIGKGSRKEFYSGAEAVLSQYIGDRMNVQPASISRDSALGYMRSLGVDEDSVSIADTFYRDCELAQFASREYNVSDMKQSLEKLNEIIKSIEKKK